MTEIKLAQILSQCPVYWQNFILTQQKEQQKDQRGHFRNIPMKIIQRELKKYGGRYLRGGSSPYDVVEFERDEGFTMFVLRWS